MSKTDYSYMLRILRHDPYSETLERMAEYFRVLSDLLGKENRPMFAGVVKKSVGVRARIPEEYQEKVERRIQNASNDELFVGAGKKLADLGIHSAVLLDSQNNICHTFNPIKETATSEPRIVQSGSVDGIITGIVGADATMHLYVHDIFGRKLTLVVRDVAMAKDLLQNFRSSEVRLHIQGTWKRTDDGWMPEASRCTVHSYEVLDNTPIGDVFEELRAIPGNGWSAMEDPMGYWEEIRGLEH